MLYPDPVPPNKNVIETHFNVWVAVTECVMSSPMSWRAFNGVENQCCKPKPTTQGSNCQSCILSIGVCGFKKNSMVL